MYTIVYNDDKGGHVIKTDSFDAVLRSLQRLQKRCVLANVKDATGEDLGGVWQLDGEFLWGCFEIASS